MNQSKQLPFIYCNVLSIFVNTICDVIKKVKKMPLYWRTRTFHIKRYSDIKHQIEEFNIKNPMEIFFKKEVTH